MSDYISRETARALMLHKQDALTECDLDSIPAADVVPAAGYHRNVPLTTLRKTPKKTLINWLRFAESNESAALEVVHRQAREMAYMEVVQHGYWVYKHKVRGGIRERAGKDAFGVTHTISCDERYEVDDPYCSECGALNESIYLNFCPNCGSRMSQRVKEE